MNSGYLKCCALGQTRTNEVLGRDKCHALRATFDATCNRSPRLFSSMRANNFANDRSTLSSLELADRLGMMESIQFCVLCLGLLEDGDVGVSVFPQREKIFVGGECSDAGSIGIRAL
jgi:hypothetical protein